MATLVCVHAHPDDECLSTGGTIARASAEGHRVVLVTATDGRHGAMAVELAPGETVVERRAAELRAAAEVLGIARLAPLGYHDSGMTGWAQNAAPEAFINAPLDEAAGRLATILREEAAGGTRVVVTTYDWHGVYGHPDHVMAHRVAKRAAAMAGVAEVWESTSNRDRLRELRLLALAGPEGDPMREFFSDWDVDAPADDANPFGEPASAIALEVDVAEWAATKRRAILCHASQAPDTGWAEQVPPELFALAFGTEWFAREGVAGPPRRGWILD
jgi:LmbE family N-acetylglucosaminyl deacetylase